MSEAPTAVVKLSIHERKVLAFLDDDYECFWSFCAIRQRTRLKIKEIRRACRSLRRKGLTEFKTGLWTEDGAPAGSGYGITRTGRAAIARAGGQEQTRACTCHPDDNPPRPCPQKYALSECRAIAIARAGDA